jgi:hypothetical protein
MRWSRLFDDLAGQLEAAERAERDAEAGELRRLEVSRISLGDRLAAAGPAVVTLRADGAGQVEGTVAHAGSEWVLLRTTAGAECLLALAAVSSLSGLPAAAAPPPGELDRRLGLGHALRRLARDRSAVVVVTRGGDVHTGTIDRVGADFLDLAEHAPDVPRRPGDVRGVRTVALSSLSLVRPA